MGSAQGRRQADAREADEGQSRKSGVRLTVAGRRVAVGIEA